MTVVATTRPPFADASPAEIRVALVSEEQGELATWRRVAWMTTAHGPEAYRRMLAKAEHTLRTGEPPAGSVPWDHVKAEFGL